MATVVVVPFPADTAAAAQLSALKYLAQAILGKVEDTATLADFDAPWIGLAKTAAARVERAAPNAPQDVKNEACARYWSYLMHSASDASGTGAIRSSSIGHGAQQETFVVNHQRAFINCGAKSLLSPWKSLGAATIRNSTESTP